MVIKAAQRVGPWACMPMVPISFPIDTLFSEPIFAYSRPSARLVQIR